MGAGDSSLLAYQVPVDEVTTVGARDSATSPDPCLIALKQLVLTQPLISPQSADISLKDMLLRKSSSSSSSKNNGALDLHLYQLFEQWQETAATRVCETQRGIEGEIEGVEALELKLLQRLNFASSVIKSTAVHLQDVYPLRFEVAQMQRNLQATIQSYNGLCAKIEKLEFSLLKDRPRRISLLGDSRLAVSAPKKVEASQPPSASSSY